MEPEYLRVEDEIILTAHDIDLLAEGGLQILSALTGQPSMTKQLAIRLGLNRARVQYIIDKLIQRGLVAIYREIHEAERVEVYYTASSRDITLVLGNNASQNTQLMVAHVIVESIQSNLIEALTHAQPDLKTTLKLVQCHMTGSKAEAFIARLEALAQEFNDAEEEDVKGQYALSLALYPIVEDESTSQ